MQYTDEIFREVGEILQLIQYIEWNLCLELEIDGFADLTLGQIKTRILDATILDDDMVNELLYILEKRNDLVHKYFKRLDFSKHSDNFPFLDNQLNYLKNLSIRVQEFNSVLTDSDE